jgi:S-DNA-T family DNA segregation ATPase FtsK/SpoIIIE
VAADTSGAWSRIGTPYLPLADAAEICHQSADLVPDFPDLKRCRPDRPQP